MRLINLFKNLKLSSQVQVVRYSSEYVPKALRSLKAKSTRNTVQFYVDSFRVRAVGGSGGDGCISFLSAWCKDHAGPDGGDGGNGGHVIFQATYAAKSLNHCKSVVQARPGERGFNKECNGKNAQHVIVPVPIGTIIRDETGRVVGDLNSEGVMFVAARGGSGGRGNKFFLTDTEQAPSVAELGAVGESNVYTLEVRSMAHVGLIGYPNAGMVPFDDYEQVAIADLPGLIPGSHKNYGLGIQFLQHAERCRGLIYLLDGAQDPQEQYEVLRYELSQYSGALALRPATLVINKIDLPEARRTYEIVKEKMDVIGVSAKTGLNLDRLIQIVRKMYDNTTS
ncbi:hypothetical protein HW555_009685 [Spodoptera exigua]|uniref:Uncharacterized protein n=1 Tax=Spodoptera exigua TaxID=7107 RepID=A0A835L3A1_SPOEX|nr:hypothetical protein HW555_009685 [Spodoptera exigua]